MDDFNEKKIPFFNIEKPVMYTLAFYVGLIMLLGVYGITCVYFFNDIKNHFGGATTVQIQLVLIAFGFAGGGAAVKSFEDYKKRQNGKG